MDDVAWGALTLSLTLLGAIYTWVAYHRRGVAAAVRGAGVTLLPIALLLTHTLRMVTRIADAVGDWATTLVFSPQVWIGVVLAGLGITLFVVGGMLRDRQIGTSAREPSTDKPSTDNPARAGRPEQVSPGRRASLPAGRAAGNRPAVDPEDDEIEALLRKHGIS